MAYKDGLVTRSLAAVLIAATLGLASPGGGLFQCRFDGLVRTAWCCEHERSTHEHPGVAQASACRCCDLLVRSPVTPEPMKVQPRPRTAGGGLVVPPAPPPLAAAVVT